MARFIPKEKRDELRWKIIEHRAETDQTQTELAEACGLGQNSIHRIENDKQHCYRMLTIAKVCRYLGLDPQRYLELD